MIGQTLSHFEITAKLGEGGMGAVYRARDGKLGREVALKVLPEDFTADPERLARFEREAQVLASLNHPNVAAIYEIGETEGADGTPLRFLVMELAEGEDLSVHLARGPIPLETALPIALQVAQGLEVAHDRGIVHRDLKPANIMIGADKTVKILDFGLAKAFAQEAASGQSSLSLSPTLTAQMTQAGTLLGTAAYMSPEQARGEEADRRADIWAFGTVLMEMLTGQKVFPGKTVSDSLAGILAREPEWDGLPADVPAPIQQLLERCLEKEVADRLQAIGEARIAIERYLADPQGAAETLDAEASPAPVRSSRLALAAMALLAALVGAGAMWLLAPRSEPPPIRKLHIPVEGRLRTPTLSPDGRILAYVADDKLFIRPLDAADAQPVAHEQSVRNPFWSPDSEWLGFFSDGQVWKMPARGGTPQTIGAFEGGGGFVSGIAWDDGGNLLMTNGTSGLNQMSSRGGEATEVLPPEEGLESDFHFANALPDGRGVLFVAHRHGGTSGRGSADTVAVWDGRESKHLLEIPAETLRNPVYAPSGHIVYSRGGDNQGVWAVPFSLERLETVGEPFLVVAKAHSATVSTDGTLAYVRGVASGIPESQLMWVDRSGAEISTIGAPQTIRPFLDLSSDDSRLVVETSEDEQIDLWVHDLERGTRSRLTFEEGSLPFWTPDGESVVFTRVEEGASFIYIKKADGSEAARKVAEAGFFPSVTPDGRWLLFTRNDGNFNTYRVDLEAPDSEPELWLDNGWAARPSPDGNFVAYLTPIAGEVQVALTRFPEPAGRWQVSVDSGSVPRWRADGRELFYLALTDRNTVIAASVELGSTVRVGTPAALFTRQRTGIPMPFNLPDRFAVSSDGQRFIITKPTSGEAIEAAPPITVVTNWYEEFRKEH